jgi:hypothetical protein
MPKKRMGRPTKAPVEGERVSLGLRVTADIKRRLEEAAVKKGRSLSQESEFRLEHSFDTESMLLEALTLAYGDRTARFLKQFADELMPFERFNDSVPIVEGILEELVAEYTDAPIQKLKNANLKALPIMRNTAIRVALSNLSKFFGLDFEAVAINYLQGLRNARQHNPAR